MDREITQGGLKKIEKTIDLKTMSMEELEKLREEVNKEISSRVGDQLVVYAHDRNDSGKRKERIK